MSMRSFTSIFKAVNLNRNEESDAFYSRSLKHSDTQSKVVINMVMTRETCVERATGEDDWLQTRECFVKAFQNYPLYTYLIPNKDKRPEFLRQYLEAIYDVLVRNGNSILVCVKLIQNEGTEDSPISKKTVIGGVLFVPPSPSGGWECQFDKDFWTAYEKYRLKDIDDEALQRIGRYEQWEYETISKHVCKSGIPMWNGVICGIDPTYAGRGCGSLNYSNCLELLKRSPKRKTNGRMKSRAMKVLYRLYEKMLPSTIKRKIGSITLRSHRQTSVVFALSHCSRAVKFHKKNGFLHMAEFPFESNFSDEKRSDSIFDVTALILSTDPEGKLLAINREIQFPAQASDVIC